jgi:hypothetical protein
VKKHYGGGLGESISVNQKPPVRPSTWSAPREKIKDLIPEGVLDELTRLVLTARSLKATGKARSKHSTTMRLSISADKQVRRPMVGRTFSYAPEGLQVLEMIWAAGCRW